MRMIFVLMIVLAGCSKGPDDGAVTAAPGTANTAGQKQVEFGSYFDGCALLSPTEITDALGGTVSKGVPEKQSSLCRFKISGQTKYGIANDIELDVSRSTGYFQDRTSPNAKGVPMVDLPELGPDAYVQCTGALWSKAPDGSTINVNLDWNLFGASCKRLFDAKTAFVQLGKAAASHAR
jgi:hypothetical protein